MGVKGRIFKYGIVAWVTCMLPLTGCKESVGSVCDAVNPCGWNTGEEKRVIFLNSDTVSQRELKLFVAYDGSLEYPAELNVEVGVTTPDSLVFTETVPMPFACRHDQGLNVSSRIYRAGAVLDKEGEYSFSFRHGNSEPVRGVRAVGIEVTNMQHGKR